MDGTRPVGTPRWMAPEQREHGGHVTPATDVWALGLIAFYLLTGRYYWRSANAREGKLTTLLRELVLAPIEFASKRAATFEAGGAIPPGFDAWFARCVVRDPAERFPQARAGRGQPGASAQVGRARAPPAPVARRPARSPRIRSAFHSPTAGHRRGPRGRGGPLRHRKLLASLPSIGFRREDLRPLHCVQTIRNRRLARALRWGTLR